MRSRPDNSKNVRLCAVRYCVNYNVSSPRSLSLCIKRIDAKLSTEVHFHAAHLVGIPLVYELDKDLKPIKHYYLATEAEIKAALDKVAAQGKAKK